MNNLLKILLIDDDEVDRMAVQRALKKAGIEMELTQAENAQTAISILQKTTFDCVFLDYRLPDMDGLDLVKELQSMEIKVPLIVLTGQGDEQIAVEMMKAGAYDYLSKSRISPELLYQTLRRAIRICRAEKQAEMANQKLRESNQLLRQKNQELKKQRQQIKLKNLELQQAYRLKSQFLATLSHELRTPMNAIMGFSQILLGQYPDPLTTPQIDIVDRIYSNSQNLMTMLNEVLDFSKIEANQMELNPAEFNLSTLVQVSVEELRSLLMEKNLNLEIDIKLENPIIINDQNCCRRILVNLLSNAIKFTSIGGIKVTVWELNHERVEFLVEDTGIGIASEDLDNIFEAFRQVDQTITRKYQGTGLGLAITYSLVEMMQGEITVESQLNKGSVFRVEIPRQVNTTYTVNNNQKYNLNHIKSENVC